MKFIIGKKQGMTQIWQGDEMVAVTKVSAGPCVITQIKSDDKDGYSAVQVGYGVIAEKNMKKPQKGHVKDLGNIRNLKEFRLEVGELKTGDKIDVTSFKPGDIIQVTGISKGKGFQGVVKRHGFKGAIKTHGTKDQVRMPGSIGATGPAHVFKGPRMGGRMGSDQVTLKNLEIIEVDSANNNLYIKGAVPGTKDSLVMVQGDGDLEIIKDEVKEEKPVVAEEKKEDVKEEKEIEDKKESAVADSSGVTKEEKPSEEKKEVIKEIKKEDKDSVAEDVKEKK